MPDKEPRWRRFQTVKLKRKDISKRAKRAEGATMRHARKFLVGRWDNIRDVRRRITVWMLGVALLIVVVGVQMLWFQQSYLTAEPVRGGTYAEAVSGPVNTLNPLYATTDAEISASKLLFSSLYGYDTTGHINADVAQNMQMDTTGKEYTVQIRPGVKWQDGTQLTADDVAFTVKLMKDSSVRSVMNASWKDINADVLSKSTVRFTLPAAYAAFPQALTFSILPKHILEKVDTRQIRQNSFSSSPVGSGPFQLRLLQTISDSDGKKVIHLGANENYYNGKPKLDRLQLHSYSSMDDIATALRTGEVSAAADVSSDVARGADTKRYDIKQKPVNSGVYAIINTTQPQLKDTNVRRALQLATDTSAIRGSIYGNPKSLTLPFVDSQLTGSDIPVRPSTNTDEAAKLLEAAGWKVGSDGIRAKDGQPLQLRVVTRKNSDYSKALELIAGQWRKVGIGVDKQIMDPASADQSFTQAVLQPRNYDVLIDELLIGGDPDVFAYWHSRGLLNFSNYSNTTSDDALVSGRSRSEPELRNVKYKAFAKQWLEDVPAIGLYQSDMTYIQSKQLKSIADNEVIVTPTDRYADVQYWTAQTGNVFKTP